jgi:hypothetical protein
MSVPDHKLHCFAVMSADSAHPLSVEIREFIAQHIHSVEQLEVLCLFVENSEKSWTAAEVFRRVQSSEKSIGDCIETFRSAALLEVMPEGYRFSRTKDVRTETARLLAQSYRERRVSVIECIYKRPSDPIQDFADAFRLRKEK